MFAIFLIFAQSIDCGYTLEPPHQAVLTSTHNLCFRAKIRKIGIPLYTPAYPSFCYIKVEFNGVYMSRACFPGACFVVSFPSDVWIGISN